MKEGVQPSYRVLLAITCMIVVAASLTAVKRSGDIEGTASAGPASSFSRDAGPGAGRSGGVSDVVAEDAEDARVARSSTRGRATLSALDGPAAEGGAPFVAGPGVTVPPGVTDTEITVVYYWKGDRTKTSPYLQDADQDGNVDEGKAFRGLIDFINAHEGDGTTLMGVPIDLHGRKLNGIVLEAGTYPDDYAATAQKISKEIRPFAAISSHGSLSTYICPTLAEVGIHNIATYDLRGQLAERTNGYCLPSGFPFERQVEVTKRYLLSHRHTSYVRGAPEPRRYGVIYAEYPGLVDAAPDAVEAFKAAGIPVVATASLAADLTTAQQQAPSVVQKFRDAGVNTIVMPDAGAPLNFTHSAQAQGYSPDYYVWPCSGQDTMGMVRLYNAAQWANAEGLTCYDEEFNPDLTNDDRHKRTEWYAAYREATGHEDVPASTPLVYASLQQLLAGIANAGPVLSLENFRAGLDAFAPYRYDAIDGRTDDPSNMLLTVDAPDRAVIGDVAKLYWDESARRPGSSQQGAYAYPEDMRYTESANF